MAMRGEMVRLAAVVWLVACGGKAIVDPGSVGSGGTSGTGGSGTGGTTSSTSTSASSSGTAGMCENIDTAYVAEITDAKACNPALSVPQCVAVMDDELACPCPTFVNPNNEVALQVLDDLAADWASLDCGDEVICPMALCPDIQGSGCSPDTGQCIDFGAD
ncbi:MAG: hypothetical protein JRI68_22490 [Deltaproteobacteria bacterium]|nr:hypothetical protein [Deltaproteobacteria bacterium]